MASFFVRSDFEAYVNFPEAFTCFALETSIKKRALGGISSQQSDPCL